MSALTDAFFDHATYLYPFVDRNDISGPNASILLQQAVCLVGRMMRHSSDSSAQLMARSFYEKAKTLIFLNYETDINTILSAMCLMSIWSPNPSASTSLDGPWPWTGQANRVALQLGLHKQSTYANRPDSGRRRRIWWFLFVSCSFTNS